MQHIQLKPRTAFTRSLLLALGLLASTPSGAAVPDDTDQRHAYRLAKLFFAARAAIGERTIFTDDPTAKKIEKTVLVDGIRLTYERMAEEKLNEYSSPELANLWKAIDTVIEKAMQGAYKGRWMNHPNFPGKLIPARFGKEVTQEYNLLAKQKSALQWTTSDEYLVNASSKADDWEKNAIQSKFKNPSWKQGEAFYELVKSEKSTTYRYAMPEYFKTSCMGCHGGEMGKKIHQGKGAAGSGTFGGLLSVQLVK